MGKTSLKLPRQSSINPIGGLGEQEQSDYEAKQAARAHKAEATGKKPRGRPPEPPTAGPGPKDQVVRAGLWLSDDFVRALVTEAGEQ
jgi:hypothetical protein